jgi:hypothetical protein
MGSHVGLARGFAALQRGAEADGAEAEKWRCLWAYFEAAAALAEDERWAGEKVVFRRHRVDRDEVLARLNTRHRTPPVFKVQVTFVRGLVPLEASAAENVAIVDFANRLLGGGVLGRGAVQEEILFATHPELLMALPGFQAFQPLWDNEAVLVENVLAYSQTTGSGAGLKFQSAGVTPPPKKVIAIDALDFSSAVNRDQRSHENLTRELVKLVAGFEGAALLLKTDTIATGKWGCGVFQGDERVKFALQLIAAALAGVKGLIYHTYSPPGSPTIEAEAQILLAALYANETSVSDLWQGLLRQEDNNNNNLLIKLAVAPKKSKKGHEKVCRCS